MLRLSFIFSLMLQAIAPSTFSFVLGAVLFGCSEPSNPGKVLYQANCTSCHNTNARLPGSIGPELYNSDWYVLKNKVVSGKYPKGYKPKRATHAMPTFKFSCEQIDYLRDYLQDPYQHPCQSKKVCD